MSGLKENMSDQREVDTKPWWRYGYVWFLLSGPAIVVVAGLVTGWIAVRDPDPVVDVNYYQNGLKINEKLRAQRKEQQDISKALLPAVQGRNHAVTPNGAVPEPR